MLAISLFGTFRVRLEGRVVSFSYSKLGALLALLVVEAERSHSREVLADMLWPDRSTKDALARLRKALSDLRRVIPAPAGSPPFFLTTRQTIQFNPASHYTLDVQLASDLLAECASHEHTNRGRCHLCLSRLEKFMGLYEGDFLSQFYLPDSPGFDEWTLLWRERWRQSGLEALADLAMYYERRDEPGRAQPYAERQLSIEPWRESAYRQLMRLAVREGNRNAAFVYYETCRRVLAEELTVEPEPETTALYQRIANNELQVVSAPHQLPLPPTPFVGRAGELAQLADSLTTPQTRLVTIVGAGGIGKSRLAIQVADAQRGLYPQGIFFVPLAPLSASAPDAVVKAIAQAVGFDLFAQDAPAQQLQNYLREKALLLVLDNCEHLLDDLGFVEAILRVAPAVKLLATSRERLNLAEEQVFGVGGLPVPAGADQPASQLFIQSARRINLDFALSADDWPHLVRLCELLDGVPLGIELAASWTRTLSCAEIVAEAARSFAFLATRQRNVPQRHRSLKAVFDYSWRLLEPHEQGVLAGVSVFRGDFTAEAAREVARASLFDLSLLVDKSLVQRNPAGRYEIHTLLRQFAHTCLSPAGSHQANTQHAQHYLLLLQSQQANLHGSAQQATIETFSAETDNIRAAWQWAIQQADLPLLEKALGSFHDLYITRGWLHEGFDMLEQAVAICRKQGLENTLLFARLRIRQGRLCEFLHPAPTNSFDLLTEAVELLQPHNAPIEMIIARHGLGYIALMQGDYGGARKQYGICLALAEQNNYLRGQANALNGLSQVTKRLGDLQESEAYSRAALGLWRQRENKRGVGASLVNLGWVQVRLGQHELARASFVEAVEMCQQIRHQVGVGNALNGAGAATYYCGDVAQAADYFRRAQELYAELGDRWGEALAWDNLGYLMMGTGQYGKAKPLYERSVVIYEQIGVKSGFAHALGHLGTVHRHLGQGGEAARYFRRALVLAVETKGMTDILGVLVEYAVLLAELGRLELAVLVLRMCVWHPAGAQSNKDAARKHLETLEQPAGEIDPQQLDSLVEQVLAIEYSEKTWGTDLPGL